MSTIQPQVAEAAAGAARKPRFDPRYIAPILVTCVLLGANSVAGVLEDPRKTGLAIICSILAEVVLGLLIFRKVPHLASAYVSGISVGILVRSPLFWPYALCGIISIASKYVLRWEGRHLWNPSNFGIAAMLTLAPQTVASLSIQFDNRMWGIAIIWILGAVIISRLKRFHICLTYVLSFVAFAFLRSLITGHAFISEVAPITGPMYQLFTLFMITDPRTTVQSKKGQMLVAFLVAFVEFLFRLGQNPHAPYYALFLVGPTANAIEIWSQKQRKAAAAA